LPFLSANWTPHCNKRAGINVNKPRFPSTPPAPKNGRGRFSLYAFPSAASSRNKILATVAALKTEF